MGEENPPAFLRLFIAVAVPAAVRGEIGRAQGQLQRCSPPGAIRWTRSEQFHVTLKFLGDVTPEQAAALAEPVAGVCAGFPALQLSAHGIGFFPGTHKPRVIWAGASDAAGQISELHRLIDLAVKPFLPPEKSDKFSSHITLGRVKPGFHGSLEPVLKRAAALRERQFGGWIAEEVHIVRSQLTSEGALHEPFRVFSLAA